MDSRTVAGLSLCSGVGGLDLGLKLALGERYTTVGYVERDAYCEAVLVARMEDKALDQASIWNHLETFDGKRWRGRVDLISAGFPCQPASAAGQRKGRADDRWLWPDIARIIRDVGPRFVFLENVRGLLSVDDGHAFGEVLGDLADLGFDAEWGCFRASDVGASHRRERVFVLAYARHNGRSTWDSWHKQEHRASKRKGFSGDSNTVAHANRNGQSQRRDEGLSGPPISNVDRCNGSVSEVGDTDLSGPEGRSGPEQERRDELPAWPPSPEDDAGWRRVLVVRPDLAPAVGDAKRPRSNALAAPGGPRQTVGESGGSETQPELRGLAHGLAPRVDRLRAAGNGVVPQQAALAFRELWGRIA